MNDADYQKILKVKRQSEDRLFDVPTVHGVSLGYKMTGGKFTDEFAICVHLPKKLPEDQIAEAHRIPKRIEGYATDIVEDDPPVAHENNSKYRPLEGGCEFSTSNLRGGPAGKRGTLGCVVIDDTSGDTVVLTNEHVMSDNPYGFQPIASVTNLVGKTVRSVLSPRVDGAVVSIDSFESKASIIEIGEIRGTFDIKAADLPVPVRKYGYVSTLTKGHVTRIDFVGDRRTDKWHFVGQLYIDADEGPGVPFSKPGDSGSVVVDDENRVVGLLWGGGHISTHGIASPIGKVLEELEITMMTADSGQRSGDGLMSRLVAGIAERLENNGGQGPHLTLLKEHWSEIYDLVATDPKTLAIWNSLPGLEVLYHVIECHENPGTKFPSEVGGKDVREMVVQLESQLCGTAPNHLIPGIQALSNAIQSYFGHAEAVS